MKTILYLKLAYLIEVLIVLFCISSCHGANYPIAEKFYKAIARIESSNDPNRIGDNDKAIGIFQIHRICWLDVKDKVKGKYEDCFKIEYSKKVMFYYLNRYVPEAVKNNDFESMARCWNSGPNWKSKLNKTNNYWSKVKTALDN